MQRFLAFRLSQGVLTIILVTMVVFVLLRVSGDPVYLMLPAEATPEDRDRLAAVLGLDRPLYEQYFRFITNVWNAKVVKSLRYDEGALGIVFHHLKYTLVLIGVAKGIALLIAVPLGVVAALNRGSWADVAVRIAATMGQSLPSFWVATMLMLILAVILGLLPASGLGAKEMVLPATTLIFFQLAVVARLMRSEMLEVMRQDYIRTARSKGLAEGVVIIRHALKNAGIPVVTVLGMQFGQLITGAVIVETIFAWPGLGWVMLEAVYTRDYPVVLAGVLVAAVFVTAINMAVDVLYVWLDPRIRVA